MTCSSPASSSTGSTWCRSSTPSSTGSSPAASCKWRRRPRVCGTVGWRVQAAWETTVTNTPPELVDAHVEDEWSLAQTLLHLVLATDAWLRGEIMRTEQPFHAIGMIFSGAAQMGFDIVDLPGRRAGVRGHPRGASRAAAAGDRLPIQCHAGAARRGAATTRWAAGTGIPPSVTACA
jgi:hypothetical protein